LIFASALENRTLEVWNKSDMLEPDVLDNMLKRAKAENQRVLPVSAKQETNIHLLRKVID
jgi:50S ribosomal subunit-associated GTPase HflX